MKTLALALLLSAGCGALFSDDTVPVQIYGTDDIVFDGIPVHLNASHTFEVDAHERHIITSPAGGYCVLVPRVQARYVVGDLLLIEMIAPPIIDGATGDWKVIETRSCQL